METTIVMLANRLSNYDLLKIKHFSTKALKCTAATALAVMVVIPLFEAFARRYLGTGIPGAAGWVRHLTLWIGLIGAILATLKSDHLSISITEIMKDGKYHEYFYKVRAVFSMIILLFLAKASIELVRFQYESPEKIGGWFPVWLAQAIMPLAFIVIAVVIFTQLKSQIKSPMEIILWILLPVVLVTILLFNNMITVLIISLMILALSGLPIYLVLAGLALLLLHLEQIPIVALPSETYQMVTQPVLPSIPLFALAGSILAAGGAPKRMLRFINAWTSWIPHGMTISTIVACAVFTAITGASGVTILALGGLLMPLLLSANNSEQFSTGLLTASGSVGLLFPPSLPVILYGVYAHIAIDRLFIASLLPGIILVGLLIILAVLRGSRIAKNRKTFSLQEAKNASISTLGDLLLPIIVIVGFFGGFLTIVETAALTALWAAILETLVYHELKFRAGLIKAMIESTALIGSLLLVLGMALGVVSYLVDAQIPLKAVGWVSSVIESKWVFLLVLNIILLLVGTIMDIFSAIVIVVPLIVPIGAAFGVDPVHLGVIFLANLELGYLTPPIGMNLFLSSLRFKKPLLEIWKAVWPFLIVFVVWVLLITYLPAISTGVVDILTK